MTASHTLYPTLEEALLLHATLIEAFGGTAGIRDLGPWRATSIVAIGYCETLSEQAAALLQQPGEKSCLRRRQQAGRLRDVRDLSSDEWLPTPVPADEGERFLVERLIVGHAELPEITAWLSAAMTAI